MSPRFLSRVTKRYEFSFSATRKTVGGAGLGRTDLISNVSSLRGQLDIMLWIELCPLKIHMLRPQPPV